MLKNKKRVWSSVLLLSMGVGGAMSLGTVTEAASLSPGPMTATQTITGTIASGSLSGGIGTSAGEKGLATETVELGTFTIGKPIPDKKVKGLINVQDNTGGKGWKLTAKIQDKSASFAPVKLSMQAQGNPKRSLNAEDSLIATGDSKSEKTTLDGTYSGEWNSSPKTGEFSYTIEWTLTQQVED